MMRAGQQQQEQQAPEQKGPEEFEDLESFIEKSNVQCLNEDPDFSVASALYDKSKNIYLKSDADEQLVIQIGFQTPVKIHHIQFRAPEENAAPKHIKLFVNQQSLDFNNCESGVAVQEFDLTNADLNGQTDLRYVKFQNVKHLTIFVQSNRGAELTKISSIRFIGQTIHETNMKNFNQNNHDHE